MADAPPPGYDPNDPYGSTWRAYNATHPQYVGGGTNGLDGPNTNTPSPTDQPIGTFGAAYTQPGNPNNTTGNGPALGVQNPGAYPGAQFGAQAPAQVYNPYLASLPPSNATMDWGINNYQGPGALGSLGAQFPGSNGYANQQAQNLLQQGSAMSIRQAPQVQTGAVNLINTGAGNALNNAGNTNFAQLGNAYNSAGVANGAGYQGQLGVANAANSMIAGPQTVGALTTAQQLQAAAGGPGAQGQLIASNALMNAANGPAYQAQMTNAGALGAAANGIDVNNQRNIGNQLAQNANGQGVQNQYGIAAQLQNAANAKPGPSVAEQQLRMGADASMRQQMALASSQRGGNAALALQNAGQNQGAAMGQLNQQQALLRAQEDINNRQFQANTLAQSAGVSAQAQNQENQALQGAAGAYSGAGALSGNMLQGASNAYGQAASTQANALNAANNGYGNFNQSQASLLGAANQGFVSGGQLQNNLLGTAGQNYGNAAATQTSAFNNAGGQLNNIATSQLGAANTQANIANTYADLAKAQLGANTAQAALNQQGQLSSQQLAYQLQQAERDALMQESNFQQQQAMQNYAIDTGYAHDLQMQSNDWSHQLIGAGIAAGGTALAALSDIRAKKNITDASADVSNAIRNVAVPYPTAPGYAYNYKNPHAAGAKAGTQYGPMAQDLEKTPAGASVVNTDKSGVKSIDTSRLSLLNTAELSQQRRELDAMKKGLYDKPEAPYVANPNTAASFAQFGAPSPLGAGLQNIAFRPYQQNQQNAIPDLSDAIRQAAKIRNTQIQYPNVTAPPNYGISAGADTNVGA